MKRKSLLLVDDEMVILESLSMYMASKHLAYDVTLAASGEDALAQINTSCFDLVVTDLSMFAVDGFQVLKAAKQRDAQTMVIILTGYGDMDSSIDALRLGADDFLQKPCNPNELLYRISNCLVKQNLQRKVSMYENFLPVCCYCKKIRDDTKSDYGEGNWHKLEDYFHKVQNVKVSHGICPDCYAIEIQDISLGQDGKIKHL